MWRFLRRDRSSPPPSPCRHKRLDVKPTPPRHVTDNPLQPIHVKPSPDLQPNSYIPDSSYLQSIRGHQVREISPLMCFTPRRKIKTYLK